MTKTPLNAIARHFAEQRFWRWATPLLAPGLAVANPTGADVVGGAVAITNTDPNTLTINQGSATAAINWQNFSVGSQEYVIFNQPSASALALNRVVGGAPSEIFGHLLANGRVFLINPNGILFGAGSRIDVGALVASTANISDADFAAGRYVFNNAGTHSITNAGNIIAGPGGFVVLAADSVTNTGLIQASLGQVVLGAGNAFTLDLTGEGLINFAVDQAALSAQSGVTNLGQLVADGGKVLMTAKTAADLARTVVNNQGLVQARSISENDKGEIFLGATGGDVVNAGTLDASGVNGANGGKITLVSDKATKLTPTSVINATGDGPLATGGSVHVSGHNVAIRGLLNIGRGGSFVLDPYDLVIADGAGTTTSVGSSSSNVRTIYEQTVEGMLKAGTNLVLTASHEVSMQPLTDGVLNGVDGGSDGALAIGIGVPSGSQNIYRYPGNPNPGGGVHLGATNAIIVGRNLTIKAGYANGNIDAGNLTAGGSIDLEAPNGITAGDIHAGGPAHISDGGVGSINVGNITAGNLASIYAQSGDVAIGDITVTGNGGDVGVNIIASGNGAGMGHINAGDDTISVHNSSGQAYAYISASKDITIDKLVVHGGGGSDSSDLPIRQLNVHVIAGGNITVNAADLSTSPRHFISSSGTSHGYGGHRLEIADMGTGFASFNADGTVTLGETGAGGREVRMETAGDATLNVGTYLNHAGTVVLNNVNVIAHAATTHEDSLVHTYSYGYVGSHSGSVWRAATSHVYRDAAVVQGEINVIADGNVSVPTGGAVTITADGDAALRIFTPAQAALEGNVTLNALGGRAYGGSDWTAVDTSYFGAAIDSHGYHSYSDNNFGSANMNVEAGGGIHVGGVLSVTGNGSASVILWANEGSYLTVDGKIAVQGNKGHYSSHSSGSHNGAQVWHQSQYGSHGDAYLELDASSGYVKIGPTGSLDVKDFGGGVPFGDADILIYGTYGVNVEGKVHVTGSYGDFHTDYGSAHKSSSANYHVGAANFEASGWYNDVHVYGGAVIDVEGHGFAQMHARSQHAGVVLDGQITVHSEAATFTEDRSQDTLSSYYNGSTWVPYYRHSENHGGGAGGSAFLGVGAYGGDLHIGGTVTVSAPINARAELYAGAVSAGTPHGIYVDSGAHLTVTATAANRFSDNTYNNPNPNSPYNSRTHYDGSQAYAGLELHGDGVYIGSGASVSVTGDGSASIDIVSSRGRDVNIDGALKVTGNRAFFRSSQTSYGAGGAHSTSHSSGSRGNASVDIHANNIGGNSGSYADVTLGSQGQIVVQDHGGQGHHTAASLQINAGGDVAIAGTITVDGDRGWRNQSSQGSQQNYYGDLHPFFNSSYADRGSADVRIDAARNVVISDTAIITAHGYGDAHVTIDAGSYWMPRNLGNVTIDGQLKVRADKGASHSANTYHNYWSSGSSSSVTRYAGHADRGDARLSISGSNVAFGSLSQVDVEGAGDAILNVYARDTLVVDGQIDVTATPGIAGSSYRYGHDAPGASESIVFAQHSENHRNFNSGSAYAGFDAGGHYGGALTINAPINVTGAGHAQAFFSHSSGSSQAITINAPVKVHDLGGAGSYGFSGSYGQYPYDFVTNRRTVNVSYAGYGNASIGIFNNGYNGDVIITGAGSIDVKAPGEANAYFSASRDLTIGGGVTLTADAGQVTENRTRDFHEHRSYDGADIYGTEHEASVSRAGDARFVVYGARDLAINAPVTVTGHGHAFLGRYFGDSFRDVTVNAPVSVTDLGSSYKQHFSSHSDGYHGTTHAWNWQYSSSTAGRNDNEFAHLGSAYAGLSATRNFSITPTGSVSVRGVEDARVYIDNLGYSGSGYGDLALNGDVTVAAQKNDYHYHSHYTYLSYGAGNYNYSYGSTQNSAAAWTNAYLHAARDLTLASGATISIGGEGYVYATIAAGRDMALDGAVNVVQTARHYDSHEAWHSGTTSGPYSSDSDTTYFYNSDSANTTLNLTAQRDLTVGGGVSVTGAGNTSVTLTAVNGTLAVNGPIAVRTTTPAHYSSGKTSHTAYNSTDSASSYNFGSHQESNYGRTSLTLLATGPFGGPGGLITIGAPVDVEGINSATLNIQGYNGVDIAAPLTVTAHGGDWHFNSSSNGFDTSFGTGESPVNRIHRYDFARNSSSHSGAAQASINAWRGPVHIGDAVTVDGEGYAGLTLNANYYSEDTVTPARNDLVIDGAVTVNAHQGNFSYGSHNHHTYSDQNSAGEVLRYASFSSYASAGTHGRANVYGYTGYGQILVTAPVDIAAEGAALLNLETPKDVTLNASVTVRGGQGHDNYHSVDSWESHYGNNRMSRTSFSSFNGSGSGSATIRSYTGAVSVNAPIQVSGATEAQLRLGSSYYYYRGDQVVVNANVTVDATGGYGGWSSYGNYASYNSTGALHNWNHYTGHGSGTGGAAYFGAFANSLVHETAGKTISVHGASRASADVAAYAGNVQLDGAVSVTADAGFFNSNFSGANHGNFSSASYGHATSDRNGAAHLNVSAFPLYTYHSSTSASTASGGNVALGQVDISAPGFATLQVTAGGPGNVSISGGVTVTATPGQFANSRYSNYTYYSDSSGNYLSSHDSHGSAGAAVVGISGNAVTLDGALIVAGNGEANAHITANGAYGDAVLNGPVTVTSGPGNVSRHDRGSHSAFSSSYSYAGVTNVVNHGGHAELSVVSAQGNVMVNAASVSGAGSSYGSGGLPGGALLELRASNGAVTAGTLAVSAIAAHQDRDHTGFYNSYFNRSEGSGATHNNLGEARIDVHGQQGVTVNGTIDASAEGYAGVTLYGGNGVATANGAITVVATRGQRNDRFNSINFNHYYGYTSSHYGSNHDSAGTGAVDVYGLTGVDVSAPVSVSAAGYAVANFHAPSGSAHVGGPITLSATRGHYSGSQVNGFHSGPSFSETRYTHDDSSGSAYLNVNAPFFVDVGSVAISAEGNAQAQINSGTLVSAGPITITATRGINAGGYSNVSGYSINSNSSGSITSHADSRGVAVLHVEAPQVFLDGAVTLTGEGGADAYVRAGNSLVLDNPITVTGNRGTHQADYLQFRHGSYGSYGGATYRVDDVTTAHSNSSAGYGAIHLLSRYNSVVVNGSLSATGAGQASVDIRGNASGGSGSVQINAPITVTATRGQYFDQSARSRTVWQLPPPPPGSSSVLAPPVASSSGAVVVEHSDRRITRGNSSGAASLTLYANGDITQAPTATIMVSGAGYANVDASASHGNVNLQGNVTAVSGAGSHFFASSGHSNNGLVSYGSNVHGSYGSAAIRLDAYPRYSSSSSIVTVTGGNITANSLTATGAGNAKIQLNAHSGGAIVVNGNLAADGGIGSYHSASFYKRDTSGISHNHSRNSFSGDAGYGSVTLNGTAGVTVHGGVTVSGNGGATASFNASTGGVTIDGPVTVTSGLGHVAWTNSADYTSGSGYHYANSSHGAADVGEARVTVQAYNGGNVTLGNVTATGFGYADVNLYASNGAVSAGSIAATAARAAGSSNYTYDYHPGPSYHNMFGGSSHWNRSQAHVDVSGNSVTINGGVTVTGEGYARANLHANGDLAVTGTVQVNAGRGAASGNFRGTTTYSGGTQYHYTSSYAGSNGFADAYAGGFDISLGGIAATASGDVRVQLNAVNTVAVNGPVTLVATRGSSAGQSFSSQVNGAGSHHYDSTQHWNSSAGGAHLLVTAPNGVTLGNVTLDASGDLSAQVYATSGGVQIGGIAIDAQRGRYSHSFASHNDYGSGARTSTAQGHTFDSLGNVNLDVRGYDGITVSGPVTVAGHGLVDARFSASNASADITLGPVSVTGQAAAIDELYSHDRTGTTSSHSSTVATGSYGTASLQIYASNGNVTVGGMSVSADSAAFTHVYGLGNLSLGNVLVSGKTVDDSFRASTGALDFGSLDLTATLGSVTIQTASATGVANVAGNLSVTAAGPIAQTSGLVVAGITTLSASSGDITLNNSGNDFVGAVSANATGEIRLTDANDILLGAINTAGNLSVVTATGNITQDTSGLLVGGTADFTVGAGKNLLLASAPNDFAGAVTISGAGATSDVALRNINVAATLPLLPATLNNLTVIFDNAALSLPGTALLGNLVATAGGPITQTGALDVAGTTTLNAGANAITLTDTGNDFGGDVAIGTATDATLVDSNSLALATSTLTGNLSVTAAGPITQSGALSVAGATSLSASTVTLTNTGNDFVGAVSTTATDATLVDSNALVLGASTLTGNLSATAAGPITQTGALGVGGTTTLSATTITLADTGNDFVGAVSTTATDLTLVDVNALVLGASAITGNLSATAAGPITQTGALSVGGATTLSAGTGSITLANAGNAFGGTVGIASATDVTLVDSNALVLGASTLTGNLSATAAGPITQAGALSVGGTTALDAGANAITLANAGNDFVGAVSVGSTTTDLTLVDVNALVLGASATTGNLSATAAGPITQTGALGVGGTTTLSASTVTLGDTGNDFVGAVSTTATDATLVDSNALVLGASTLTGDLSATAAGPITQTGALSVGGATTLSAGTGSITLTNTGNAFGGAVGITAANAALVDSNALALAASTLTGNLSVGAAGPITQVGALSVGGTTTLNAGANAITLDNSGNDFVGSVSTTGTDATLVDSTALVLGASTLTGNLSATAAGSVTQTGALSIGGATSLSANTVTLTNTGNDFVGAVDITAADATLVDGNAFTFGASTLTGNLSVSAAGPITQAGALSVAGTTSLAAGANAVTLTNANNDFGGAVGITAAGATLVDTNDLTLGAFTITNSLLASAGGDIAIAGTMTANLVDLTAAGSVTDNGVTGGSITAGAVGIKAGTAINLGATALSVGTGVAPFGDDPQAQALLQAAAPAGFFGDITPNGAFAAPSVTFGAMHLTGNAIYIQANSVGYAGAITFGGQSLPPSGFVVHYDTFTPDAAVHVVGALPGTVVAGDAYYDAGDFAYPGTTYLIGNSNSNSPMQVGENGPPSGGTGGDDNFFFMTDNDVSVITPIPTTGQVMVIRPHTVVSDFDFLPIAADWETTTTGSSAFGDDQDKKDEKLEHEGQTQTAGTGQSEEGQIDNQSSSNLECH